MNAFERSTLRWTKATFIVFAGTMLFIALQWKEMKSGGSDTHELALQAKASAESSKIIADKAAVQASATNDLAIHAKSEADLMKLLAERSLAQANAMTDLAKAATFGKPPLPNKPSIWRRNLIGPGLDWWDVNAPIPTQQDQSMNIVATVINAGRRPARINYGEVTTTFGIDCPSSPINPPPPNLGRPSKAVVVPGNTFSNTNRRRPTDHPTDAEWALFNNRILQFYVLGRVEYQDIRLGAVHTTLFCTMYSHGDDSYVDCPCHNDAD